MSAYIHGSLALDDRSSQAEANRKKTKTATRKVYRSKGVPGTEKLLWISVILICCTIAGIYQFRQSAAYEINSQITQMESEIRLLEEENAMLKNEIAKLESPARLIEAGIQLGLTQQSEIPAGAANGGAVAMADGQ